MIARIVPRSLQPSFQEGAFDRLGQNLQAFDLVRVVKIPHWYLSEPDDEGQGLKEIFLSYQDRYGMIKYSNFANADGVLSWFGDNKLFTADVIKLAKGELVVYEFTLSGDCVERIPHNLVLSSLFANYDWPNLKWVALLRYYQNEKFMGDLRVGFEQSLQWPLAGVSPYFGLMKEILEMPYEALVAAHEAALVKLPALRQLLSEIERRREAQIAEVGTQNGTKTS
jgi:hypothetical protein